MAATHTEISVKKTDLSEQNTNLKEQWPSFPKHNHYHEHSSRDISAPVISNLRPNSCAQYAICTILPEMRTDSSYQQLCESMNPNNQPTAARPMVELLDARVGACSHNKANAEDLKTALDNGRQIIAFISSANNNPHWVVVSDYQTDAKGQITHWELIDTNFSFSQPGGRAFLSNDEFLSRWANPESLNNSTIRDSKYANYWIEVGTNPNQVALNTEQTQRTESYREVRTEKPQSTIEITRQNPITTILKEEQSSIATKSISSKEIELQESKEPSSAWTLKDTMLFIKKLTNAFYTISSNLFADLSLNYDKTSTKQDD